MQRAIQYVLRQLAKIWSWTKPYLTWKMFPIVLSIWVLTNHDTGVTNIVIKQGKNAIVWQALLQYAKLSQAFGSIDLETNYMRDVFDKVED